MRLVECVPNFSEGRNQKVINEIADAMRAVEGVNLLDVDPGASTNRTVMTLVGEPDAVVEAAFQGIVVASKLIDMRFQKGEHPRMGATDVCPFIPVADVTMQDSVKLAEKLGERVGKELGIPVYLYGEAARKVERRSLADIRKGEYEALPEKMKDPGFKPDFGPFQFNAASGATVIGARPFLIAYNVNLNTKSKKLANEIALTIREAGRNKRTSEGKFARDADDNVLTVPGTLKACRAVGWVVDEYRRAQVSINLTDISQTSMHDAFDEVERLARDLGLRVTGSEVVGLVPLSSMLQAGRHYLKKQGRSTGVSEAEIIEIAIQSLGLAELAEFDPGQKIIEYRVAFQAAKLADLKVSEFLDELASESPAPGGGSVAALAGSMAASLCAMVANLTFDKKGFEKNRPLMNDLGEKSQMLKAELLKAVDDDTEAFNSILTAMRMPRSNDTESSLRDKAILEASKEATLVPLSVMKRAAASFEIIEQVVEKGNPNSLSDAGVAGLMALACVEGAYFNVLINLDGFDKDDKEAKSFVKSTEKEATALMEKTRQEAERIRKTVLARLTPQASLA
ncbi:MAG: glutamate formimidoyltransferase [Candidatus Obscuribacterales bacterium]|nr:glutamate formimidoyltransferase [Candidatus Obscuribacterales bacterium]